MAGTRTPPPSSNRIDRPIDRIDRYCDAHAFILATERRQTLPRIAPPVRILSFRDAGCAVVSALGRFPRVLLGGSAVQRAIICAIHRDQWRFELLLMSARGNIFFMCGRLECVSFVRFDVIRGTITAHAHSQHVPASPISLYMTEIQVLSNYSHSVYVLNEINSIPTNHDTMIRYLFVCFLSDDVNRR